ncbi:MAG: class I SAM-dependent rRNA methyltransferase [Muribaculaceae bacterium]|nr:class I SAM-dependent rRNA methyltransferase [Muribaculaceae bacterium]
MKKIILQKGREDSLQRYHPWVFSGAIKSLPDDIEDGDLVQILAADGKQLGIGHYQVGSIAVKMLHFGSETVTIDETFYSRRIAAALDVRRALGLLRDDNTAFRLVHGEGDFLPGLVVDVYGHTAVMQAHSPGIHFDRDKIAAALTSLPDNLVTSVYYKSETTLPFKAQLDPVNDYLVGGGHADDVAIENGLRFHIDWLRGQKTGFFVDQRENRCLLEKFSRGRRVLNMFCYTGGFSVYAMRGGATLVHSVDSSAKAISLTDANISLNFNCDSRHKSFAEDAFKYLDRMENGAYDLVILDPPAFAKRKSALRNALIGYRKLNAAALQKMPSGSVLFTFSCSQAVNREQFRLAVFSAAAQAKRRVRILHQLSQPADHPINIYHPEGEYLKGLVLWVE